MTSFAGPLQFDDDTYPVVWEWVNEDVACPTVKKLGSNFSDEIEAIEDREDIEIDDIPCDENHRQPKYSLPFKCFGATKNPRYQEALERAREQLMTGRQTPVCMMPEEDNPADANAIAFPVCIEGDWKNIRYVARELASEVKLALHEEKIISCRLKWIKFQFWPNLGIGFYASIDVTQICRWSALAHAKRSTVPKCSHLFMRVICAIRLTHHHLTRRCTCMAGLGEACSHVAALLFAVDCRNRMESEVTCTSVLCQWKKPPSKRVDCLPTSEIDFVSPKRKLSEPSKTSANKAKHICDPSESHLKQLYKDLSECDDKAAILALQKEYSDKFSPEKTPPLLTDAYKAFV